jgi:hypothetical protein
MGTTSPLCFHFAHSMKIAYKIYEIHVSVLHFVIRTCSLHNETFLRYKFQFCLL